ncbi:MAG: hypothetical protein ACYDH5_20215 [Acidimicrobiales bacterium]
MPLLVCHPLLPVWLAGLPKSVQAETSAGLRYFQEHARGAVLPEVRHRIQASRYFPDMSEVRVNITVDGRRYAIRVLTCFVDEDRVLLACIGGDKEGYVVQTGHDWYDDYVPIADQVVEVYLRKGKL